MINLQLVYKGFQCIISGEVKSISKVRVNPKASSFKNEHLRFRQSPTAAWILHPLCRSAEQQSQKPKQNVLTRKKIIQTETRVLKLSERASCENQNHGNPLRTVNKGAW